MGYAAELVRLGDFGGFDSRRIHDGMMRFPNGVTYTGYFIGEKVPCPGS